MERQVEENREAKVNEEFQTIIRQQREIFDKRLELQGSLFNGGVLTKEYVEQVTKLDAAHQRLEDRKLKLWEQRLGANNPL